MREGDQVIIPVMMDRDNGRMCGVGCCVIRSAWLNGELKKTGYLSGLKIHPDYQRRLPHVARAYETFYQETKGRVDLFYTTILKENMTAQRLLEKRRKGMPAYHMVGEYTVYCFRTGVKLKHNISGLRVEQGNMTGVKAFYKEQLKKTNFAPGGINLPGFSEQDIYTLRDGTGQIFAACGLWNQQSDKQYIITGYGGLYRILKHIPLKLLGYPNLPAENIPANYASIALLCVKDHEPEWAQHLINHVAGDATVYDFLMAGLFDNHPLNAVFHQIKHIKYQSRLYTVHWEDDPPPLDGKPVHLEVGLL
jgi:hypothetical protein